MSENRDPLIRCCLVVLVLLLALIAVSPLISVPSAQAASAMKYRTEVVDEGIAGRSEKAVQQVIQERTQEGWEVVTATVYYRDQLSYTPAKVGPIYVFVFRK
jgi:hypothetical protein